MGLISERSRELYISQIQEWPLAKMNYDSLQKVKSKTFRFGNISVIAQFNPARMQSSSAKTDIQSIRERKCFLCPVNLPVEQKSIPFGEKYQVLVNPFPIFPIHFTIPTLEHTDQLIYDRYDYMLDLAKDLDEYVIFYNGPKCGASAPDHAHYQAGTKGSIPLEDDIKNVEKEVIYHSDKLEVFSLTDYLRNAFLIQSEEKERILHFFKFLYSLLELKDGDKEPMMNVFTWYERGKWSSCIFPREKHRPNSFYAEGEENILVSPGAVDMGGILIFPLEKDFVKITQQDIENIFQEVCISDRKMQIIIDKIKSQY